MKKCGDGNALTVEPNWDEAFKYCTSKGDECQGVADIPNEYGDFYLCMKASELETASDGIVYVKSNAKKGTEEFVSHRQANTHATEIHGN